MQTETPRHRILMRLPRPHGPHRLSQGELKTLKTRICVVEVRATMFVALTSRNDACHDAHCPSFHAGGVDNERREVLTATTVFISLLPCFKGAGRTRPCVHPAGALSPMGRDVLIPIPKGKGGPRACACTICGQPHSQCRAHATQLKDRISQAAGTRGLGQPGACACSGWAASREHSAGWGLSLTDGRVIARVPRRG